MLRRQYSLTVWYDNENYKSHEYKLLSHKWYIWLLCYRIFMLISVKSYRKPCMMLRKQDRSDSSFESFFLNMNSSKGVCQSLTRIHWPNNVLQFGHASKMDVNTTMRTIVGQFNLHQSNGLKFSKNYQIFFKCLFLNENAWKSFRNV